MSKTRQNTQTASRPQRQKGSLGKLFVSMKAYLVPIIIASVLLITSVIIQIFAPQKVSDVTNTLQNIVAGQDNSQALADIREYCIILIICYAVIAVCGYLASFIFTTVSQLYAKSIRKQVAEKINRIPLSYFDSHQFGDILSTLTNDVDNIGQSLQNTISMIIQSAVMLVAVIIAMFVTSWQMALAVFVSLPLMLIMMVFILKFAQPQFKRRQDSLAKIDSAVEEDYSGQLIVKCFNAEERTSAKFEEVNEYNRDAAFKAQIFGGLMQPLMNFISYIAYAAVFIVGGLLIASDTGFTYGTITSFMIYVNLFQSPLSQIAQAMNTLQTAGASATRVFDFLEQSELSDESNKERKLLGEDGKEHVEGRVEFKHVSFSYDSTREIIHDFSAVVEPGMKVAIVGPTGAGKTTMVNLLMRFYEIDSGDITIDGVSIKDMPREEIHDIFGMVLQDTWMFEGTVRENLVYNTPDVTEERIEYCYTEANLAHYIHTLPGGLDYYIHDEQSISGGQKQLITISRAMIKEAPLLILDEATSNVDTRTEEKIQEAMDKLTEGRTSFVIAHRLSTIRNADLILVMKDGNIVEQGNHDSLMAQNGFYASLYNAQFSSDGSAESFD